MSTLTPSAASDLFRAAPDRFLDVGAGEVAVRTTGDGPDVLFVHGWPVSGATFRTLLPRLVDHVRCHVIDLPGAGSSRFDDSTPITIDRHIESVRRVVDLLGIGQLAVVGHDSGGMIARHALADDPHVRAWGLIDTEQPHGLHWRFKTFLVSRHVPGIGPALGWVMGRPRLRRNGLVLGRAFVDSGLLDGEFDEFFLRPINTIPARAVDAAIKLLASFDEHYVSELAELHSRMRVPVQLVWGEQDAFFPVAWAREMVSSFPDAGLEVVPGAGLFSHEEQPAAVARALLPGLTG